MTPDARRVAFISDRSGTPQLWVQDVVLDGPPPPARHLPLSADPVVSVRWAADSRWLACAVATDGGVRTQVWVVRPDGTDARRIAGDADTHAELGPWTRSGHHFVITFPGDGAERATTSFLADPATGRLDPLTSGPLIHVLDISLEERFLVIRDGERGQQFVTILDRLMDEGFSALPAGATGSTEVALIRPAPEDHSGPVYVYLASDVGLPRRQLLGLPFGPNGWRGELRTLAARDDADLEWVDADDAGRLLLLVWNVAGSQRARPLRHLDPLRSPPSPACPAGWPRRRCSAATGSAVLLSVEGSRSPRELWHLDTRTGIWTRVTDGPAVPDAAAGASDPGELRGQRRPAARPAGSTARRRHRARAGRAEPARRTGGSGAARVRPAPPGAGGGGGHRVRAEHPRLLRLRPRLRARR